MERNVRNTKLYSPDYAGRDADDAVLDFPARIEPYTRTYEPVDDEEGSFIRLTDNGRQVELSRIDAVSY